MACCFKTSLSFSRKKRSVHPIHLYIALIGVSQGINPKKPFYHPAIVKTIQEFFFQRKRGPSIAQKYHSLFGSSMDTGTAAGEPELPPAMVAMAAVAVSLLHHFYSLLTTPTRSMHPWTRGSLVWISMQILMKILTILSSHSWRRSGLRDPWRTTDLCLTYISWFRVLSYLLVGNVLTLSNQDPSQMPSQQVT